METVLKIIHCISLNADGLLNESYCNGRSRFIVHPAQAASYSSGKESRKTSGHPEGFVARIAYFHLSRSLRG